MPQSKKKKKKKERYIYPSTYRNRLLVVLTSQMGWFCVSWKDLSTVYLERL